jgi:hypothetical protein
LDVYLDAKNPIPHIYESYAAADYGYVSAQLPFGSSIGQFDGGFGGISGVSRGISRPASYFNISFAGNKKSDGGKHQKQGEDSEPFSIVGYSFFGGIRAVWRRSTPGQLFTAGLLIAIGYFGLALGLALLVGGK